MNFFQVILLSIIEGLTEFLPISSTGHLLLAQKYLQINSTDFSKTFDIVIQLAAILAVVTVLRDKIFKNTSLWKPILVSFLPTGIIGFLAYKTIKNILFENPFIIVYALLAGGLILLLVDRIPRLNSGNKTVSRLSLSSLFNIGLIQSLSIIPGVSRSAASIVGGLVSGLSRQSAVEFSFLLAIPTMFAASGYDLLKSGLHFSTHEYFLLIVGCFFSFLSAFVAVKTFLKFIKNHNFSFFAIYRIVLALIVWFTLKP